MTRAPVVAFPSVCEVVECMAWLESKKGFAMLRDAFNETSSHADLLSIFPNPVGCLLLCFNGLTFSRLHAVILR
ncbi:unnamed protein product [Dibothriocephalus latus]|uniref:Uncharacterized protein n=1 Tax=Dibothriocephalus latus TaxID=60516 RepID=A0A3P7LS03_DIBLA|nr:unnamed protein product [Dibothriocephalus latus]